MPQLPTQEITEITLPSSTTEDPAIVSIKQLTAGDIIEFADDNGEMNSRDAIWKALVAAITEWNFTEEDGTPTPITVENIKRLSTQDFTALVEALKLDSTLSEKKVTTS